MQTYTEHNVWRLSLHCPTYSQPNNKRHKSLLQSQHYSQEYRTGYCSGSDLNYQSSGFGFRRL